MRTTAIWLVACFALWPAPARAGGTEFPADGTRGLGRGGANFARADDPGVMLRNPALLADLWDDQALLGAHLLLADSCFRPTGAYGWGVTTDDVSDFGEGPLYLQAESGDLDVDGRPLTGYADEPFPGVCYQGPAPFLPFTALAMKLSDDLGVGVGFFPPETAALAQFGNADGTIDTSNGLRPNPLRYLGSHLNASYFSALGAVGYRLAPWIRVGLGLQWSLVAFDTRTWAIPIPSRDPRRDVRADTFGRDLFIPGLIASVHLVPFDVLEVAFGAKWQDNVRGKAKLDLTSGAFGTGEVFEYIDAEGGPRAIEGAVPTTTHNQRGTVDAPPIWAPQLSVGIRYADRLAPRSGNRALAHAFAGGTVEDAMATERWDVELDAVYYLTSVYDKTSFFEREAALTLVSVQADGAISEIEANVGDCTRTLTATGGCPGGLRENATKTVGKNQWSARLGGDYNVLPGVLALRAGGSLETDGQDVGYLNPQQYMLARYGLHAGLTWRIAGKTDVSFGFAHFIHRDVRLQVNDAEPAARYPSRYKTTAYHFAPGAGVEAAPRELYPDANTTPGDFDGVARLEIPYGGMRAEDGPFFVNAGSFFYHLEVVSLAFTQHF